MKILVYHPVQREARMKINSLTHEEISRKDLDSLHMVDYRNSNGGVKITLNNGDEYQSMSRPTMKSLRGTRWDYAFAPYGITAEDLAEIKMSLKDPRHTKDCIIFF